MVSDTIASIGPGMVADTIASLSPPLTFGGGMAGSLGAFRQGASLAARLLTDCSCSLAMVVCVAVPLRGRPGLAGFRGSGSALSCGQGDFHSAVRHTSLLTKSRGGAEEEGVGLSIDLRTHALGISMGRPRWLVVWIDTTGD